MCGHTQYFFSPQTYIEVYAYVSRMRISLSLTFRFLSISFLSLVPAVQSLTLPLGIFRYLLNKKKRNNVQERRQLPDYSVIILSSTSQLLSNDSLNYLIHGTLPTSSQVQQCFTKGGIQVSYEKQIYIINLTKTTHKSCISFHAAPSQIFAT